MLQFLGMVFPKDLLHYFELTGFADNIIPEKERLGVESGELVVHLEERDCLRHPEKGHIYRPNGFYEASPRGERNNVQVLQISKFLNLHECLKPLKKRFLLLRIICRT